MSFVEIDNLHINLGEFRLKGVSLSLDRGDYLTIIGPTGAGKTIFLESIVGFWRPDQGNIVLDGRELVNELPEKRHIGIVYQDYALLPHMTVYQNIAYGLKKHKPGNMDDAIRKMAGSLHIDHLLHRKPTTLSGGEQQRAALARVLIVEPALLLMDEPFSALDQQTRRRARLLLKEAIRDQTTTVIHITHDLDDAWALANKLAVFKDGRLLQLGALHEVFNRPNSRFVAEFVGTGFYRGTVVSRENGSVDIDLGGTCLQSFDQADQGVPVDVAIRHEDIRVSRNKPAHANGFNVVKATLKNIVPEGSSSLLDLQADAIAMHALIPHRAMHRLNLHRGDDVYAWIRKEHVNIVQAG
ncbi:ABC transporter ATPase [Desulfosarcina ovata subsp. sediminis]|uniref:ABC transporter ATPase n=1 Tax=Desulfosarcina ovata subsp. sediminis TaxID=885957 RepID=A0A5K7ZZW2_9BACT|nr:ATP-binding cassette domain-containing protein [Desulfosarcina ovata]BBO85684.1 ABC transporter ATPase [Desulfosarcina ovata subsp. sediminis]